MATLKIIKTLRVYAYPYTSTIVDLDPGIYRFSIMPNGQNKDGDAWFRLTLPNGDEAVDHARFFMANDTVVYGESEEFMLHYNEGRSMPWRWLAPSSGSRIAFYVSTERKKITLPSGEYIAHFARDRERPNDPSIIVTSWKGHRIGICPSKYFDDKKNMLKPT